MLNSWINDSILVLDDNIARHRLFRIIYGPREARHVHSIEGLRLCLDEMEGPEPFSIVFLDHDLVPVHYRGDHDDECGCAAVKALRIFYTNKPKPKVVIHSRNSSAAQMMAKDLGEAGFSSILYMPFE